MTNVVAVHLLRSPSGHAVVSWVVEVADFSRGFGSEMLAWDSDIEPVLWQQCERDRFNARPECAPGNTLHQEAG